MMLSALSQSGEEAERRHRRIPTRPIRPSCRVGPGARAMTRTMSPTGRARKHGVQLADEEGARARMRRVRGWSEREGGGRGTAGTTGARSRRSSPPGACTGPGKKLAEDVVVRRAAGASPGGRTIRGGAPFPATCTAEGYSRGPRCYLPADGTEGELMDPAEAIADLKQVSPQIHDVAVASRDGRLEACSATGARGAELARVGAELHADAVAASAAAGALGALPARDRDARRLRLRRRRGRADHRRDDGGRTPPSASSSTT